MSLRALVTFAQNEISHHDMHDDRGRPPLPPLDQRQPAQPPSEDSDSIAQRTLPPDWIGNPQNDVIKVNGENSSVFTEGDFDSPIAPTGNLMVSPDALAFYLPFHFYRNGVWGIYLKAKGILELAAELKGGPITHGGDDAIRVAVISLFEHELFHCLTELAATRAEVVARYAVYHPYFFDRYAAFHEEAAANAHAHRKISRKYSAFVTRLEAWMMGQGPGYRDFHRYCGRSLGKGRLKCSQHIIRFAPPTAPLPSKLPSEFLFRSAGAGNVPVNLVVEPEIGADMLRPFPKRNGVVVKTHSREHPPPHVHVEIPPGREKTRIEWPSLEPLKGDPQLSNSERARLREYLQRFGGEICERLRSIYRDPQLPMPAI
jgi:hypothetical protein